VIVISGRNFSGQVSPPKADKYIACNLGQPDCRREAGKPKGIRLWPNDDTPRSFERCRLTNCELPPGSTTVGCRQAILEKKVLKDTDTIKIDGEEITTENYERRVYGKIEDGDYLYFARSKTQELTREHE